MNQQHKKKCLELADTIYNLVNQDKLHQARLSCLDLALLLKEDNK